MIFPAAILSCKARSTTGLREVHFHLRSPARPNPNPIGTAIAHLVGIEGAITMVRGLDCFDGTRRLDLKPDRGLLRRSRRRSPAILKSAIRDFDPRGSAFQNAFRV